jgi:bifunctional non-homologous end joining protein LigD
MTAQQPEARVEGIDVRLSHLDKVFFPDDGITKGDLVEYYRQMAPRIITFTRDRPLVMHRFPEGITGPRIVQQNAPRYFPDWVTRTVVVKQRGTLWHVLADKPATPVYLANQGFIEFHVFLSRVGALYQPNQVVFDLDPPDQEGFTLACRVAVDLRELLTGELGLTCYVKTTGGKGLHVHVPVPPPEDFDTVRGFARDLASMLASRSPTHLTTEQRKDQRGGGCTWTSCATPMSTPSSPPTRCGPGRVPRSRCRCTGRRSRTTASPPAVHAAHDGRGAEWPRRPMGGHGPAPYRATCAARLARRWGARAPLDGPVRWARGPKTHLVPRRAYQAAAESRRGAAWMSGNGGTLTGGNAYVLCRVEIGDRPPRHGTAKENSEQGEAT